MVFGRHKFQLFQKIPAKKFTRNIVPTTKDVRGVFRTQSHIYDEALCENS